MFPNARSGSSLLWPDETERAEAASELHDQILERFEQVAALLREMDIATLWEAATAEERRVLILELVEEVAVLPDHLEVAISVPHG